MEGIIILSDIPSEKILAPKPKRLFPKKKHLKRKKVSCKMITHQINLLGDLKTEKEEGLKLIKLDSISFDEINDDFKALEEKTEEEICYKELSNILSSSSEDFSSDDKSRKTDKVKRPKKPTERNVLFLSQNTFSNYSL